MENSAESLARAFVGAINRHDVAGVAAWMATEPRFIDALGHVVVGRVEMKGGWPGYFRMVADSALAIAEVFCKHSVVMLVGMAEGTYAPAACAKATNGKARLLRGAPCDPCEPITSRVAGPRTLRCAPFLDRSRRDAWLPPLPADCSAFHFVYLMLRGDLTRPLALDACWSRGLLRGCSLRSRCAWECPCRLTAAQRLRALPRSRIAPRAMLKRLAARGLNHC